MSQKTGAPLDKKTRTRIIWISSLVVVAALAVIVVMNIGAASANGADTPDSTSQAESNEKEEKAPVPVEVTDGERARVSHPEVVGSEGEVAHPVVPEEPVGLPARVCEEKVEVSVVVEVRGRHVG